LISIVHFIQCPGIAGKSIVLGNIAFIISSDSIVNSKKSATGFDRTLHLVLWSLFH
jgi:hypothetical protein